MYYLLIVVSFFADAHPNTARGLDREENTCLHLLPPLSTNFLQKDMLNIKVRRRAMLVFISLSLKNQEPLLQDNALSLDLLKRLVYHICKEALHPQGTVIVPLSTPYLKRGSRVTGELTLFG